MTESTQAEDAAVRVNARELAQLAVTEHGAEQKPDELASLLSYLQGRTIRRVLEIGVYKGGTFWLWRQLIGPEGTLIGVDLQQPPCEACDRGRAHSDCPRARLVELGWLVQGDSHSPSTVARVRKALGDEKIDLLHIDGDHDDPGVAQDVDTFVPFVRRGGVVVFHDIASDGYPAVKNFWKAIRAANPHVLQFVVEPSDWGGIGVVPM